MTSHIHKWVLCLYLFILSRVIILHSSPVAYWTPTDLGSSSFSVLSFFLFILFMGFSRQEYWSGLPFPFPVDHVLSELSTMIRPSSNQISHSVVSDSLQPHELQHTRPPCPSPTPRVHSDSRPSNQWCHPGISSSVVPFSSCPQSLPASESFPMSQLSGPKQYHGFIELDKAVILVIRLVSFL